MDNVEYGLFIDKIKKILQNIPLQEQDVVPTSEEADKVQAALVYLSQCFVELDQFSGTLCRGELDGPQPSRHNYLAGGLKELHAVLRHLTWQTKQVANGDYRQRVNFLGDFSDSFNQMVEQLEERERKLKESAHALEQSIKLVTSIMDNHKDWIVVTAQEDDKVLYNNQGDTTSLAYFHLRDLELEEIPKETRDGTIAPLDTILYCDGEKAHYYAIQEYPMVWQNRNVVVHYIADVTKAQEIHKNLSEMAYRDQLTRLYNRHFCMVEIEALLEHHEKFSLALVDVNELKYVNDYLGHDEGDDYLIFAAQTMERCTCDSDYVCRIGGDEFIILLKECEENIAHKKMEEIFQVILAGNGKPYPTSISYGITYTDGQDGYSAKELIEASDRKMYQFKQTFKQAGKP